MEGKNATGDPPGDEGEGFLNQLKNFTEGFIRLKSNKELMSKTITDQEKKIQELELESEKKVAELRAIKEERRLLLNDLERSRFEVVKLNEQNVALRRELQKYKGSINTPERKTKGQEKKTVKDVQGEAEKETGEAVPTEMVVSQDDQQMEVAADLSAGTSDVTGAQVPLEDVEQAVCQAVSQAVSQVVSQAVSQGTSATTGDETWQPLSTEEAQTLVAVPYNDETPQKKAPTVTKGMVVVYKTPDEPHTGYKTSVPLEVLQQETTKKKHIYECRQIPDPGVSEETHTINVIVEEYGSPDVVMDATVNDSANTDVGDVEVQQAQPEENVSKDNQGTSDSNSVEVPMDASDETEKPDNVGATPKSSVNPKGSQKRLKKKRGRKKWTPAKKAEKSQAEKESGSTDQDNEAVNQEGTVKESFLSSMNLSSAKGSPEKADILDQTDEAGYKTRSGRKLRHRSPVSEKKIPNDQKEDEYEFKTPSRIKKEKIPSKIGTEELSENNNELTEEKTGDASVPVIVIDPVREDIADVYYCSACNLGFKTEAIFDRHIRFRHGGAGLPSAVPMDFQLHDMQTQQTGSQIPLAAAEGNSSGTENIEPVNSEQMALQNGDITNGDDAALTPKKRKVVPPKLKKEVLSPSLFLKKEPKQGPPHLKKEDLDSAARQRARISTTFKRHECALCGKRFAAAVSLTAHINKHKGFRPFECQICEMRFYAKSDRNKHVKITHNAVKSHFCTLCGKGFTTKVYLDHHMASHSQERKYGCDECGRRFKQKPHLDKHIQLIHRNERTFICMTCGKAFGSAYGLKSHETTHTGEKIFSCDTCGKSFGNKGYLLKHQMYHTGDKKYMCIHCQKLFYLSTDLQRHMRIHTNDKAFACSKCEYRTTMKSNLKVHELTHAGLIYTCSVCGRKLTSKASLFKHSKLHEELPKYEITEQDSFTKLKDSSEDQNIVSSAE